MVRLPSLTAAVGFAPAATESGMPTFTAAVRAVQQHLGCSQNRARRATRDYINHARRPSVAGLLEHAALVLGRAPIAYADPTGNAAVRNVNRARGGANV